MHGHHPGTRCRERWRRVGQREMEEGERDGRREATAEADKKIEKLLSNFHDVEKRLGETGKYLTTSLSNGDFPTFLFTEKGIIASNLS